MSDIIEPGRGPEPIHHDDIDAMLEQRRHVDDRILPGDTTAPAWVLGSIVFGLFAVAASIALLSLVASAVVIAWVIYAGRSDTRDERGPVRPFHGLNGLSGPWTDPPRS